MSTFAALFACQLLAALSAVVVIGRRAHALLVMAPLEAATFTRALRAHIEAGELSSASALVARLQPAYCAELAQAVLRARAEGFDPRSALNEALDDLRERTLASLLVVQTLGRIAPPLAFAAAIVTLGSGFGRDVGLLALQRGLAESIAVGQAMLSVVTGMTVSLLCRACTGMLLRWGRALQVDLKQTAAALAPLVEPP